MDSLEEIQECTQKHYGGSYVFSTFIRLRKLQTDFYISWVNLYFYRLCLIVQECVIFVCKNNSPPKLFLPLLEVGPPISSTAPVGHQTAKAVIV